jgi:hypothetical protein
MLCFREVLSFSCTMCIVPEHQSESEGDYGNVGLRYEFFFSLETSSHLYTLQSY